MVDSTKTVIFNKDIEPLIERSFLKAGIDLKNKDEFSISNEQISIIEKELERFGMPLRISDLVKYTGI
jgi:hypothetical protein